ncbi:hypothetical protein C5167_050266 [Papaver somniferum]|uniref:Cytochrome b561 domain-containing protein n=1 Tax=Papaver somniferum TaxID=3469 RepID=A0A4Y7KS41_PAPSO|nr:probable transmembrane ascorbate ferrireductase 4 isoform X2 [Papaver somniferum]RZC74789.1 hypothetical protein C5167_050266 [Papaver somniferum]
METSSKPTASSSSSTSHLIVFARLSGLLVAVLVLVWGLSFRSNFLSHTSSTHDAHMYSVFHVLVMVIGFVLISGEGSRNSKKLVHLTMQGVALASGTFGIWTKFYLERGVLSNFYSLHSWMGLMCISLFAAQWLMGFFSFWHRGEERTTRIRVAPWHVFLGLYIYGLAIATAEAGLLEKLTFLEAKKKFLKHSLEPVVVNSLGLGLALLGGITILTAVSTGNQSIPTKIVCSSTSKRSSS